MPRPSDRPQDTPGLVVRALRGAIRGPYSFTVRAGTCAVIAGASGAGKSLLLRMIADLDPNEGQVWLDGTERASLPAPLWRRRVCYLPAEPGWWAERVVDHMAAPEAAAVLLPRLGLAPALMEAPVSRLSTGERQRAALVRAIVQKPRWLLLDEPTAALDPASTAQVETELHRLKAEGVGLLIVSHNEAQAARLAALRFTLTPSGLAEAAS